MAALDEKPAKLKPPQWKCFSNIQGDISGGLATALMALPGNIIYGLIAFSPLGPEFSGQAILAGIYSSVFAGFFSAVFGGTQGMISGPRAPTVLVFGSVIGQLLATQYFGLLNEEKLAVLITLGFVTVLLSGIIQILFGLLNLGRLVKYISFPVIAGILNGTAVIVAKKSIWGYLGVTRQDVFWEIFAHLDTIKPLIVLVAFTSTILWIKGKKFLPKVPGALLGLLGGTCLYYLLSILGFKEGIGTTLGSIPSAIPTPRYLFEFIKVLPNGFYWQFLPVVATGALTIAILNSLLSLMAMLTMQNLTNERADSNRELIGQGIANVMNSLFGAIPGGGAASRVMVNFNAGGRTRLSGVVFSLVSLFLVLICAPLIGYIPKAVTAGMSMVVAWLVLEKWSLRLMKEVFRKSITNRREIIMNIAIIFMVMFAVLYFNIIVAVGLGVVLSFFMFVEQMSKSLVRRTFRGDKIRSKKQRFLQVVSLLDTHGSKIAIIELEGAVFFGTTDALLVEIDNLVEQNIYYLILDMKRITTIDVSGARMLQQIYWQLTGKGIQLVFSYLHEDNNLLSFLKDLRMVEKIGRDYFFDDTNMALEYCEDSLIERVAEDRLKGDRFVLQDFLGVEREDYETAIRMVDYVDQIHYKAGDLIVKQGDPGDSAYIISRGLAAVTLSLPDTNRVLRLVTFSYGTMFGEMTLLDREVRSANVEVVEDVSCFKITTDNFEKMRRDEPDLAMILMHAISKMLVERLRQANITISELER